MSEFAVVEGGSAVRLTDTILGYNEQELSETLKEVASEIGVNDIAYLRFSPNKSSDTSLLTAVVTYSREWQLRYFSRQYVKIDPVVTHGRNAFRPFDWEILGDGDRTELAFFADAVNHGVGRNGLSIPVRNRIGIFSLVSFSSDYSRTQWEQYKAENMAKLQLLSCLIDSAANINFKLPTPPVKLSQREEQCLIWAARGKTYQEIGDILDLTFGSVKTHLDSARRKLHCMNLTHAAAVAVATGVIPAKTLNPFDSAKTLNPLRREEPAAKLAPNRREPSRGPSPAAERSGPAALGSGLHSAPIASETMRTSTSPPATAR
jgi:DNA-binding CsgD family transcriptional regulator